MVRVAAELRRASCIIAAIRPGDAALPRWLGRSSPPLRASDRLKWVPRPPAGTPPDPAAGHPFREQAGCSARGDHLDIRTRTHQDHRQGGSFTQSEMLPPHPRPRPDPKQIQGCWTPSTAQPIRATSDRRRTRMWGTKPHRPPGRCRRPLPRVSGVRRQDRRKLAE